MPISNFLKPITKLFTIRRLVMLILVLGGLSLVLSGAAAQTLGYGLGNLQGNTNLGNKPLIETIGSIINIFLGLLGVIAVGLIIYAGYTWMTAAGNEEKIAKAKKILSGAVIGLVIIFAAFGVAAFVINQLTEATGAAHDELCPDGINVPPCPVDFGGESLSVKRIMPSENAIGVKLCSVVSAEFGKPLDHTKVESNFTVVNTTNSAHVTGKFYPRDAGDSLMDVKNYSFRHLTDLFSANTKYAVTLNGGPAGLMSVDGLTFITDPGKTWYFTTGSDTDSTLPTVKKIGVDWRVQPPVNSTEVCRSTPIQAEFSEPMDPSSFYGNVILREKLNPAVVIKLSEPSFGNGYRIVTFNPVDAAGKIITLDANKQYEVILKSGDNGITDACGNPLDGNANGAKDGTPGDDFVWSFTTGTLLECKPNLDTVNPTSGHLGTVVTPGTEVKLTGSNLFIDGEVVFNGVSAANNSFDGKENILCWNGSSRFDAPDPLNRVCNPNEVIVRVPETANTGPAYDQSGYTVVNGKVKPGPVKLFVQPYSSNEKDFTITTPFITGLSPSSGGVGQYVTVQGWNFGSVPGKVMFGALEGEPPVGCDTWWNETEIVVKVPVSAVLGNNSVQVITANSGTNGTPANKKGNREGFKVTNDPPGPGICSITPNSKSILDLPTDVTVKGERFGAAKGTSKLYFGKAPNIFETSKFTPPAYSWSEGEVKTQTPTVNNPAPNTNVLGNGSWPVCITLGDGRKSNCKNFSVEPDTTKYLSVVEDKTCSKSAQSPSPYLNSNDACGNAVVQARFNMPLAPATVILPNIDIRVCNNGGAFDETACTGTIPNTATIDTIPGDGGKVIGFKIIVQQPPNLVVGTWYEGVISKNITSESGAKLKDNYKWHWQVANILCPVDKVNVLPPDTHIREIPPNLNITQPISADPVAANCNSLDPNPYGWNWQIANNGSWVTMGPDVKPYKQIVTSVTYMPNPKDPAIVTASIPAESKQGTGDVYVDPLACKTNADCVCNGIIGISSCVKSKCTPVITDFSPDNGAIGTWVNIGGCYFGKDKGKVLYNPNEEGLWPDPHICPASTWSNTEIISEVPPTATKGSFRVVREPGTADEVAFSSANISQVPTPQPTEFTINNIVRPGICSLQPRVVYETQLGTPVADFQVKGKSFGSASGSVEFYKPNATPPPDYLNAGHYTDFTGAHSWSDIAIVGNTPTGTVGTKKLTVKNGAIESGLIKYEVRPGSPNASGTAPVITGLSPADGIATKTTTTVVTIDGHDFGTVPGRVFFGDAEAKLADCYSWGNTQIKVAVPADTVAGGVPVVVKTNYGTSNNDYVFTTSQLIRPGICSINPEYGKGGTQVVINGRNFTDNRKPPLNNSFISMKCDPADWPAAGANLFTGDNSTFDTAVGSDWVVDDGNWSAVNPPLALNPPTGTALTNSGGTTPKIHSTLTVTPGHTYRFKANVYFDGMMGYINVNESISVPKATSLFISQCGSLTSSCPDGWHTIDTLIQPKTDKVSIWINLSFGSIYVDNVILQESAASCFANLDLGNDLGNKPNRFKIYSDKEIVKWSDKQIVFKVPPKVRTGTLAVSVDYGWPYGDLRSSNPVAFWGQPFITSITPDKAPKGAWVTIKGGNFSDCSVRNHAWMAPCTVNFAGPGGVPVSDDPLPNTCDASSWTDSQIIAKVPAGVSNATGSGTLNKLIHITNKYYPQPGSENFDEDSKPFTLDNNLPLPPGLCKINPNPLINLPQGVVLSGDNFSGAKGLNDKINFSNLLYKDQAGITWQNESLSFNIPNDVNPKPISGNVTVDRYTKVVTGRKCLGVLVGSTCIGSWQDITQSKLVTSNPMHLDVNLGGIATVAKPQVVSVKPVANPYQNNVCRNPLIQVTFSNPVNLSQVTAAQFTVTGATAVTGSLSAGGNNLTFVPTAALEPNQEYTVKIDSPQIDCGILAGPPVCEWKFKTGGDICSIDKVELTPSDYTFSTGNTTNNFTAQALDAKGQPINADYYWSKVDKDNIVTIQATGDPKIEAVKNKNRNGNVTLTVVAELPAALGGRADPLVTGCPTGYSWFDRNSNSTKDPQECVKPGNTKSATSNITIFLCEAPWILNDSNYTFRLKYCRAEKVKMDGAEILQNGDFEKSDVGSLPDKWVSKSGSWSTTDSVAVDGIKSVKVEAGTFARLAQEFPIDPSKTYVVRAKFNTNNIGSSFYGGLWVARGACTGGGKYSMANGGGNSWQDLQVVFSPTDSTNGKYNVCLWTNNGGAGSFAYFDAISIHEASGLLSDLRVNGPTDTPGNELIREYFLKNPDNPDALGVRIYKNPGRLSPRDWYQSRKDIVKGSPKDLVIDGYPAVQDGNTVYVYALRFSAAAKKLDSYIYVLTYNKGATSDTKKIYDDIVKNLLFNANQPGGDMDADTKGQLQRDLRRFNDRQIIRKALDSYAENHGYVIPTLVSGSYLKGFTTSKWDSWGNNLSTALKQSLPQDPINKFNSCPDGYDSDTCWNAVTKNFSCPVGSHVYQYKVFNSNEINIYLNPEFKMPGFQVTWTGDQQLVVTDSDQCDSLAFSPNINYATPPLKISMTGTGSGFITPAPLGTGDCSTGCTYTPGTTVTLTALEAAGSVFTGWGGDCVGTNTTCTIKMVGNKTVRANFVPARTLQIAPVPADGTISGANINCGNGPNICFNGHIPMGSSVTLSVTPKPGYVLSSWGGDCSSVGSGYICTLEMDTNKTITANFVQGTPLSIAPQGTGSGNISSSPVGINCGTDCHGTFLVGSPVTLTALPNSGSVFSTWGGACSTSGSNLSCTITPTSINPLSATATFLPGSILNIVKSGAGTGTVTSNIGGLNCGNNCDHTYAQGAVVTLTATNDITSKFTGWSGGCTVTSPTTCDVTMDAAKTITATFDTVNYTLDVSKAGSGLGKVTGNNIDCPGSCNSSYAGGTSVKLIATAGAGSIFNNWSGDCATAGATPTCNVTMDAAKTVTATFITSANSASVTITKTGSGTGTIVSNPPAGIDCGDVCMASFLNSPPLSVTLKATAAADNMFGGWSGGSCSGTNDCVVTLGPNVSINANFAPARTLTVVTDGSGTVASTNPIGIDCGVNCIKQFASGTAITLKATPTLGFVFTGWSGGSCSGTDDCTVTLINSATVKATFTPGFTLDVNSLGTGAGTVTSTNVTGINCGATCSATYPNGILVALTATPDSNSVFSGWSGACTGMSCSVTMSAAKSVTANFKRAFTLTVSKDGTGSGTVTAADITEINCGSDCKQIYAEGTSVTLTAIPSAGSTFEGWSGGGCTGTGNCTVNMTAAVSVNARFKLVTWTLTVNKVGLGIGTVVSTPLGINCPGTCSYVWPAGTVVTLSTTEDPNSVFDSWSGGCIKSPCNVSLDADKTVTASFAVAHTLSISFGVGVPINGSGVIISSPLGINCGAAPCNSKYPDGTTVVLTATANDGSVFTSWGGDGSCAGSNPDCTLLLSANKNVQATFTQQPSYRLDVNTIGFGSVTSMPGGISCGAECSASYASNSKITLIPSASDGYLFAGWSGVCTGIGVCIVTMNADQTVNATFTSGSSHVVNVSLDGLGSVTSTPIGIMCGSQCTNSFADGSTVVLMSAAKAGYIFDHWSGDCSGTAPDGCVFSGLSADKTVVAHFIVGASYNLDVQKIGSGNGTVTSNPVGIDCGVQCSAAFANNKVVTLTATADANSGFAGWTGDCSGINTTCTLTINAAKSVQAKFEPTYTLTVQKGVGTATGKVSSSPSGINNCIGCSANFANTTSITLTATPDAGFVFDNWTGDVCNASTNATCTFTIDANKWVTANFKVGPRTLNLTINVAAAGNSVDSGTAPLTGTWPCTGTCAYTYNDNTAITLVASAAANYTFTGWSGIAGCTTNATCNFNITTATVNATANYVLQAAPSFATCGAAEGSIPVSSLVPPSNTAELISTGGGTPPPPKTTVTFGCKVNPNGLATTAYFRWFTSNPGVCSSGGTKTIDQSVGSGGSLVTYAQNVAGLSLNTTYWYCGYAYNSVNGSASPITQGPQSYKTGSIPSGGASGV